MNIVKQQRNAHIRRILENLNGKGRQRTSLSQAEAEKVALRVDRLLRQAVERTRRFGKSVSMRSIAKEVWPDHGENYASSNLQRFVLPKGFEISRRSLKLTRTAHSYVPLIGVIAKYLDRDPDDVLIEVFQGTVMDSDTERLQADGGYALNGNEFESWLWERARQLGERHRLADYYRSLCLTGGMRDLERRDVTLVPGDLCEPLAGDLLEAGFLPVLSAASLGLSIPYVWQGLVPTVALYRIQIAPRKSGMLRVNKKGLQELVPVELIRLYEVRFGIAPTDKSGVSGPVFECVEMLALEEKETGRRLIPQNPYREPCRDFGMMPEDGVFWRGTEQIQGSLCAGGLLPQSDILPELDPEYEAVVFEPADFERCHKFLVEWPERFPNRVEAEDLEWPAPQGETEPSIFPTGTLGAVVETELCRDEGLWNRLETQADTLIAAYRRYQQQQNEAVSARQACALQKDAAANDPEIAKSLLELRPVDWRKRLGLTQQAAAWLLGVALRTYVYYEHEKKVLPRSLRLAMAYCELHRERAEALAHAIGAASGAEQEINHA